MVLAIIKIINLLSGLREDVIISIRMGIRLMWIGGIVIVEYRFYDYIQEINIDMLTY